MSFSTPERHTETEGESLIKTKRDLLQVTSPTLCSDWLSWLKGTPAAAGRNLVSQERHEQQGRS